MKKVLPMNLYDDDLSDGVIYKKKLLIKKIVKTFYMSGNKTISHLAEITKNSVPTVANVIDDLLKEGWIQNFGIGKSRGGRRPAIYGLSPNAGYVLARFE